MDSAQKAGIVLMTEPEWSFCTSGNSKIRRSYLSRTLKISCLLNDSESKIAPSHAHFRARMDSLAFEFWGSIPAQPCIVSGARAASLAFVFPEQGLPPLHRWHFIARIPEVRYTIDLSFTKESNGPGTEWRSHFRKEGLFESVSGFSLGWSSMVLFGRVVQKRTADVGADTVGTVEQNIPEDDPRIERYGAICFMICLVIADIVGEIAGMGYDLVGFYVEPTCAALVFGSISSFGINHNCNAVSFVCPSRQCM
ncbi:hypothetical protein RHSIM_Rhsim01G0056300 [Rhododendron simsii]|uniref:H(+)-exporting diphosphatase n=1 Tax=Rhododendron simsii TaxID=118357 RepID=A0A834HHD2_RHOSS|nr:hypothetical protein RHSIM_Rhsim01G0056300 [Rhododendron simsii]